MKKQTKKQESERTEFAKFFMAAIIRKAPFANVTSEEHRESAKLAAAGAVWYADALIEQLGKNG